MRFLGVILLILCTSARTTQAAPQRLQLGRYGARALYQAPPAANPAPGAPAVLLIPGSGESGPEELAPADATLSGKDEAILDQFASAFQAAGYATLQLGKPGVEFHQQDLKKRFYDESLYNSLTWAQYLDQESDVLTWLAGQPGVDPSRVFVLGHSEGTDVAIDLAERSPRLVRGIFLLGYTGVDFEHTVSWQLFDREIDAFMKTDVDLDHDGRVTQAEIAPWDDTFWPYQFQPGDSFTYAELLVKLHGFRDWLVPGMASFPLWKDIFSRGPSYARAAALKQSVRVFTGELDVQTPASGSRALEPYCAAARKADCRVVIVPGVGHAFSAPRGPRAQRLVDATFGPVAPTFLEQLRQAAAEDAAR